MPLAKKFQAADQQVSAIDIKDNDRVSAAILNYNDQDEFAALYNAFSPRLLKYFLSHNLEYHMAEDLIQKTWLKIWQNAHKYESGKGTAKGWIYTIAHSQIVDQIRKDSVVKDFFVPLRAEIFDIESDERPVSEQVESEFLKEVIEQNVETALDRLNLKQRHIFMLYYERGCTHSDVSKSLKIPQNTVLSITFRMRAKLSNAKKMQEAYELLIP